MTQLELEALTLRILKDVTKLSFRDRHELLDDVKGALGGKRAADHVEDLVGLDFCQLMGRKERSDVCLQSQSSGGKGGWRRGTGWSGGWGKGRGEVGGGGGALCLPDLAQHRAAHLILAPVDRDGS